MFNILSKVILLMILFLSHRTFAMTCISGKIRYLHVRKFQYEASKYCFNELKNQLISENCKDIKCDAKKLDFDKIVFDDLFNQIGSPAFKLCRQLNGVPSIIEFWAEGNWYKLDRCYFTSDKSFIDTDFLFGEFQRFRGR